MTIIAVRRFLAVRVVGEKEGEESYSTHVYQQCFNESLVVKGEKQLTRWQWYELVEKKTHRGKVLENDGKRTATHVEKRAARQQEKEEETSTRASRALVKHGAALLPACQVKSETEEWWFDVHPKGMGKRRPCQL